MANLIISLKKHTSLLATSVIETETQPQFLHKDTDPMDVAALAANYVKYSICSIMTSKGIGDCKSQALTTLLGFKRTWVAAFGVSAAIACWAYMPSSSPEDIILRSMSPWQDMAYEMWHMCR